MNAPIDGAARLHGQKGACMTNVLRLNFLAHSGFAVETATKILVFDYYKDPAGIVDSYAKSDKPLWFFVSHSHEDHYNRHIADFAGQAAQYIMHRDVPVVGIPQQKLHTMNVYDSLTIDDTTITAYGSTDEGCSFLVETEGTSVFHAGDLNWWHWLGDTDENNADAKRMFDAEMKRLAGVAVDVAFFPVDARLEAVREWGVMAFLDDVQVRKCLVPMHCFGTPWTPSIEFQARHDDVPLWLPQKGDSLTINL